MLKIWESFINTMKVPAKYIPENVPQALSTICDILSTPKIFKFNTERPYSDMNELGTYEDLDSDYISDMKNTLSLIYDLPEEIYDLPFIRRDTVDIMKTIVLKKLQCVYYKLGYSLERWFGGKDEKTQIKKTLEYGERMLDLFGDVLSLHEDNSMFYSFLDLKKNREINPHFESALKEGLITEDQMSEAMETVSTLEANYHRLAYIMFLLDMPNKKSKKSAYIKQYQPILDELKKLGADLESIKEENSDALSHFKIALKNLTKKDGQ
jgi:hypothetical protein